MLKIGVTGGIGSGKTTVCQLFEALGVPIYNSDIRAKELMVEDQKLVDQLKALFGESIYSNGVLQRKVLASKVFGNPQELEKLNQLVHPAVGRDYTEWLEKNCAYSYTIKEAALIFEAGIHKTLDKTIFVSCPEEIRVQRVINRDGVSKEEVAKRIASQWSEEEKRSLADIEIVNDGKHSLIKQVVSLHKELVKLSKT